ncbi:MAG: peptidylprolyl isomerase, partial [Gemmatimonadota bacterium]
RLVRERVAKLIRRSAIEPDFAALVRQASEDSVSRAHDGFMPALMRSGLPAPVSDVVWALTPGAVGPALRSAQGYHIFRRASRVQARPYLRDWLIVALAQNAETRFQDSLMSAKHVVLTSGAESRIRALAQEPVAIADSAALITWAGGALHPAQAQTWVMMLLPDNRTDLSTASDVDAQKFLMELARREVLLQVAAPTGPLTADARRELGRQYALSIDTLRREVQRVAGSSDPGAAATASIDSAGAGRALLHPLPGALAGVLRSRYPVTVDLAVVDAVVQGARKQWFASHRSDTVSSKPPIANP